METNQGINKMDHVDYPVNQKDKCFMPSFRLIIQSCIILHDVFTTTSMNINVCSLEGCVLNHQTSYIGLLGKF
jgi:hypothetical protein